MSMYSHIPEHKQTKLFFYLFEPGDTILGMSLAAGGHLTHGAKPNQSGKWFNAVQYGVNRENSLIDFDEAKFQ